MFWQETLVYIIKAILFFAAIFYFGAMIWIINFGYKGRVKGDD